MTATKDIAICTRRQDYSDTSQIITLFGRRSGKIKAIAKGSRRPCGKFGGGIDLLTAGEILFVPPRRGNALAILTEFTLTEPFADLRHNLLALHAGQYLGDLISEFTEQLDPHEDLFDAYWRALHQLQSCPHPAGEQHRDP